MNNYDVIILGAGPAGSMLLRLIEKRGLRVCVVDKRNLDCPASMAKKIKSCGGMVAPDAQKFLRRQGLCLPNEILDAVQPKYVRTYDAKFSFSRNYKRNYINVCREGFDRFLLKGLDADFYFDFEVNKIEKKEGFFVINDMLKAPILVGADGAGSKVRRVFYPQASIPCYVSIQDVIKEQKSLEYECFFDEKTSDYYGWSIPKKGKTLVGFAVEQKDAIKKFEAFKSENGFGKRCAREGAFILRPGFLHQVLCEEGLFLIGEAGGYISPSSAEGFSYAFRSAKILADSNFEVKKFKQKMKLIQFDIFYKNLKAILMYTPFLRRLIMRLSI